MLWETLAAARDLGRLHEIATILIRYGFGDVVRTLGMGRLLEQVGKALHWAEAEELAHLEPPERVRRALEELGPTFVKLGQIFATRIDLFPPEYITEFEKLQDRANPLDFEALRPQLEEDLGGKAELYFSNLDTAPLASASIAQVHRAELSDGSKVILKIRRPGIDKKIGADLRLMSKLAQIAELEMPSLQQFHPQDTVRQFSRSLRYELDLARESRNAERMATNFKDDPNIRIPKVYWQLTGERLNVQEYIEGIPGRDLDAVEKMGLDRKLLAKRGVNAVLKMIIEDGFFHADPHPGNLFYQPGEKLVFIDFGMIGYLSEQRRYQLIDLLNGLITKKTDSVVDVMLDWTSAMDIDSEALAVDLDIFIDQYHSLSLKQLNVPQVLNELIALMRDHKLALPQDLALMTKALLTLEGLGWQLDPSFNMSSEIEPFLGKALLSRYAPDLLMKRGWEGFTDVIGLIAGVPKDLKSLVRAIRKNTFKVNVEVAHLDQLTNQMDRSVSRLTMGMITAALIIGSSIVMTVEGGPTLFGLPFFGLLGFLGAVVGSVWLLMSIWRSGK